MCVIIFISLDLGCCYWHTKKIFSHTRMLTFFLIHFNPFMKWPKYPISHQNSKKISSHTQRAFFPKNDGHLTKWDVKGVSLRLPPFYKTRYNNLIDGAYDAVTKGANLDMDINSLNLSYSFNCHCHNDTFWPWLKHFSAPRSCIQPLKH